MTTVAAYQTIELSIGGMDCAECTRSVRSALLAVPGVNTADVLLAAEKAIVRAENGQTSYEDLSAAVTAAGYAVRTPQQAAMLTVQQPGRDSSANIVRLFVLLSAAVLFIVVGGEWLGLFETLNDAVPLPVGITFVVALGYPVFRNVANATRRGRVISHTLMTVGVIAALVVGQWVTAVIVVFFMRAGDFVERYTVRKGRSALADLLAMSPTVARVIRDSKETTIPINELRHGESVIVRPGEAIPVDGEVISGRASVDQAAITGESQTVEVGPGSEVFASTIAQLGSLEVSALRIGIDSRFGQIIQLVEEAELQQSDVQRVADRFSTYFLPLVGTIALITFLLSGDAIATAAVLVVACSCSLALATPVAMLASTGSAAKHGLLIKGGKYFESLSKADVLLIDKTGTLTLGQPSVTDTVAFGDKSAEELLEMAASAEMFSEHPLAEAVRTHARTMGLLTTRPESFEAIPGQGVRAVVSGHVVEVGHRRSMVANPHATEIAEMEELGKTVLLIHVDKRLAGLIATTDTLRPEIPVALARLRSMGFERIEVLTGDNLRVAAALATQIGVDFRAELMPEDKIAVVREYQASGHTVVMIGDGVNDAPALAQANIGIAMGAAGTAIAAETADVVLMRDDWSLVPMAFELADRTMRTVHMNIGFTAVYNVVGLTLAAIGLFPPVVAAAAQSIPDLGIMANSSRLLRFQPEGSVARDEIRSSESRREPTIGFEPVVPHDRFQPGQNDSF